jgi:hypothetical protein
MRRLRIGATIRGTFDIALDWRVFVDCAGGWSVLLLVARLGDLALHSLETGSWVRAFGELGGAAATLLAFVGMAVNVHRRVLLGESPRLFRIGRSEMRYAWRAVVIGFAFAAAGFALALLCYLGSHVLGVGLPGRILIGFFCACVMLYLMIEFIGSVLVLPAAAIDEASFRWSGAWQAAENNRLAILLVGVICGIPLALPSIALMAIDPWLALQPSGSLVAEVVRWMIDVAAWVIDAAWISLVFSGLVDGSPDFALPSTDGGGDT